MLRKMLERLKVGRGSIIQLRVVEAHQESLNKWVIFETVFEGMVRFQQEDILEKHNPEGEYNMRKVIRAKNK